MSDPIRTVPQFVAAAQAGDGRADKMAAGVLDFRERHGQWFDDRDVSIDDAYPGFISCWEPPPFATGIDGRLLVKVLDALATAMTPATDVAEMSPQAGAWAAVAAFLDMCDGNWFIAACAALLAALGKLERS